MHGVWPEMTKFRNFLCKIPSNRLNPQKKTVLTKFRKKGFGKKIIDYLISEAKKLNIKKLSIETGSGSFFAPARKLFEKTGFKPCEPFAHYKKDPNSCYFSLDLII